MKSLYTLLESVNSKESLLVFMKALELDRLDEDAKELASPSSPYGSGANGWENGTISSFIEAMHAWATDSSDLPESPSWRTFADILLAGKIYE